MDIKTVTYCPTCGSECKVAGEGDTHYYVPVKRMFSNIKRYFLDENNSWAMHKDENFGELVFLTPEQEKEMLENTIEGQFLPEGVFQKRSDIRIWCNYLKKPV